MDIAQICDTSQQWIDACSSSQYTSLADGQVFGETGAVNHVEEAHCCMSEAKITKTIDERYKSFKQVNIVKIHLIHSTRKPALPKLQ